MSLLSLFGMGEKPAGDHPSQTLAAKDGTELTFTFFAHASLSLKAGGAYIYLDPVGSYADYASLPRADVILITHHHSDHLDREAVEALLKPGTEIVCSRAAAGELEENCHTMRPGNVVDTRVGVKVQAVAAYNTSAGHLQFHPREREDCGFLLTVGGTKIYFAGDTEPTPEMRALKGKIDILFLPVNQPYTMTVDQAVETVRTLRPARFYPYHYGEVEEKTDLDRLVRELEGTTEVHLFPME